MLINAIEIICLYALSKLNESKAKKQMYNKYENMKPLYKMLCRMIGRINSIIAPQWGDAS